LQTRLAASALKSPEYFLKGYAFREFLLDPIFRTYVTEERWDELDAHFKCLVQADGEFFQFLKTFHRDFSSIEFIISIRDAANEWEEDGIWHDDGSRVFAFSLSLTLDPSAIQGGYLELRKKSENESPDKLPASLPTPPFGTAILFLTGVHGFEHRTRQVLNGKRIILAGWCSL